MQKMDTGVPVVFRLGHPVQIPKYYIKQPEIDLKLATKIFSIHLINSSPSAVFIKFLRPSDC